MATSGSCTDPYSGRPAFNGYLVVSRSTVSGTRARWAWSLYARNPGGSSQTYHLDQRPWSVNVEGQGFSGTHSLDFRGGQSSILLGNGVTGYIEQGAGTPTINFSFSHGPAGIFGTASASGSLVADRLATVPGAPSPIGLDQIEATSMRYRFSGTTSGGVPVLEWQAQIATNPSFTTGLQTAVSGGTTTFTGLTPATTYYARSRGRNAVGWGNWSATSSATTMSGAYVSLNGAWVAVPVYVSDGSAWDTTELFISDGTAWEGAV